MALTKILVAVCLFAVVVEGGYTVYPNPARLSQVPFVPPYIPDFSYPPSPPQFKEIDIVYPPPARYQEVDYIIPQPSPANIIEETFDLRPRYPFPAPGFWQPSRGTRPVIIEEYLNDPVDEARNFNSFQISTTSTGSGGGLTVVTTNENGKTQTYVSPSPSGRGQFYRVPQSSSVTNRFLRQALNLPNVEDIPEIKYRQPRTYY